MRNEILKEDIENENRIKCLGEVHNNECELSITGEVGKPCQRRKKRGRKADREQTREKKRN